MGSLGLNDPEARRAALAILTAPEVEEFVVHSVPAGGVELLWQAWELSGDTAVLAWLAHHGDRRASEALARAIVDPAVDPRHRDWLIRYADRLHDSSVVPALVAAAELPDNPLEALGRALLELGAQDEGQAMLARALREATPSRAPAELGRSARLRRARTSWTFSVLRLPGRSRRHSAGTTIPRSPRRCVRRPKGRSCASR